MAQWRHFHAAWLWLVTGHRPPSSECYSSREGWTYYVYVHLGNCGKVVVGLQESVDTPEKLDFKNDSCKWLKAISNHLAVSPFNKEHNFAAEIADWDLLALDVPRVKPWLGCLQSATFHAPTAPAASTTPSRWRLLRYGCAPGTTHQPGIEMVAFDMIGLEVASCYIVVCFPKLELWPVTWSLVSTDLLREAGQVLWVIYIHIYPQLPVLVFFLQHGEQVLPADGKQH